MQGAGSQKNPFAVDDKAAAVKVDKLPGIAPRWEKGSTRTVWWQHADDQKHYNEHQGIPDR